MFFIVWGKKQVKSNLGYVADFCPLCRSVQPFELGRLGIANHVYHATVGQGEFAGNIRTCSSCGTELNAEADHYATISKTCLPIDDLIQATNPNVHERNADRLAIEAAVRQHPEQLSPDLRAQLIREPFVLLAPRVEAHFSAGPRLFSRTGGIVIAILLGCLIIPSLLATVLPDAAFGYAAAAVLLTGVALIAKVAMGAGDRYIRTQIFPTLLPALRPLKPSEAEIASALQGLAQAGQRIGKRVKARLVVNALDNSLR